MMWPAATIFAIEDDITAWIAGALAVKLTNLQQARAAGKSAGNLEAYDLVLRGRELLTRLNRTTYSQARTMFERAIALDPHYAAAYVGLGRVDLSAVALGWTADPEAPSSAPKTRAQGDSARRIQSRRPCPAWDGPTREWENMSAPSRP